MRTLVRITPPLSAGGKRTYDEVPRPSRRAEILKTIERKSLWGCGNSCLGLIRGLSTFALINPDCDVHGHVLSKN